MTSTSRRFVLRFRLQTMLVLTIAFSIALGLVAQELNRERGKKQSAAEIRRLGGSIHYSLSPKNEQTGVVNGYLRLILGDEYFPEIDSVSLNPRTEVDLELLHALPTENVYLSLRGDSVKLDRLTDLTHVSGLSLEEVVLQERDQKSLTKIRNLHSLSFVKCPMAGFDLRFLTAIPTLSSLSFKNCSIDDSSLMSLYGVSSSASLHLQMTNVTEAGRLALREANPGWAIYFSSGNKAMDYLPSVRDMPEVEMLTFHGSPTSDATVAVLKNARRLTNLNFDQCSLTDSGLSHLQPLQNLTQLSIVGAPITDEGLQALAGMGKLQGLSLLGSEIEGFGLGYLPSSIRWLALEVPAREVAEFVKLPNLEELMLSFTTVSEEGIDGLVKMQSLRQLDLFKTSISDAGLSRLRQSMPNCRIYVHTSP